MSAFIIALLIFLPAVLLYTLHDLEKKRIERDKVFQKWIFESLYSIDHKVLLPEEHEKPAINKKAVVYIPSKDPMAEFRGQKDDFYE